MISEMLDRPPHTHLTNIHKHSSHVIPGQYIFSLPSLSQCQRYHDVDCTDTWHSPPCLRGCQLGWNVSFILMEVKAKAPLERRSLPKTSLKRPRHSSYNYTEEPLSLAHATHMNTSASPKDVYLVTKGFVPKMENCRMLAREKKDYSVPCGLFFFSSHAPRSLLGLY